MAVEMTTGAIGTNNVLSNLRVSDMDWKRAKSKRRKKKPTNRKKGR